MPKYLTLLTTFLVVAGFSYNLSEILHGSRQMASEHANWAAGEWPLAVFWIGVLYGRNVEEWIREHPWAVIVASWGLAHCLWPIR